MNKKQTLKKTIASVSAVSVAVLSCVIPSFAADKDDVSTELYNTSAYLIEQNSSADYTNDYVLGAVVSRAADESFCESYKDSVADALSANGGKLMYTDYYTGDEIESLMYESTAAIVLNKMGYDTADIGGYDLAEVISNYDLSLISNPYHLCEALKAARIITAGDETEQKLLEALMSYYTEDESDSSLGGMDYWGISTDNNGVFVEAIAPYADTNDQVKTAVEKSINFIKYMKRDDGYDSSVAYASDYGNPDSTALALRAFAAYGDDESASEAYELLLGFKSENVSGAYLYFGEENLYATKDAQFGLLAYYEYVSAKDVSDDETDPTETNPTEEQAVETATAGNSEESTDAFDSSTEQTNNTESTTYGSSKSGATDSNPNTGVGGECAALSAAALIFAGVLISKRRK